MSAREPAIVSPMVVSYGGGTNSTALLVGLHERGILPDLVLFADTGAERPETYSYLDTLRGWLELVGFPPLRVVRWDFNDCETLEQRCLRRKELPSLAYGNMGCSSKFKRAPIQRAVNAWCEEHGQTYDKSRHAIGIDAGEAHRSADSGLWRPLVEWDWGREECVAAIGRAGLPQPGKSACFFCPGGSRKRQREVLWLAKTHPDLCRRALALEANAEAHSVVGLGRGWRWSDLFADTETLNPRQVALPLCGIETPCACFDGEAD